LWCEGVRGFSFACGGGVVVLGGGRVRGGDCGLSFGCVWWLLGWVLFGCVVICCVGLVDVFVWVAVCNMVEWCFW